MRCAVCKLRASTTSNKLSSVFCLAYRTTAVPTAFASGPASAPGASGAPPFPWGKRLLGRKRWHPMLQLSALAQTPNGGPLVSLVYRYC
jgi:hypothetical protein